MEKITALAKSLQQLIEKTAEKSKEKTVVAFPKDYRVDRAMKAFMIPEDKVLELYKVFLSVDKLNAGSVLVNDYFEIYLQIKRNLLTDAALALIDTRTAGIISWGEFVELTCTFACFEQRELIRFCFMTLDLERTGSVDKNELKHFVNDMWDHEAASNIHVGLDYLDEQDKGDGQFTYNDITMMHAKFPMVFYPAYRLQIIIQRYSFGEDWWELQKKMLLDTRDTRKQAELNKLRKQQEDLAKEEDSIGDEMVKKRMGVTFYLLPCLRDRVRIKLSKIAAINKELESAGL